MGLDAKHIIDMPHMWMEQKHWEEQLANCFGVYCQARDMTIPTGLDDQRLNIAHILPKILGFLLTTLLVDEEMVTARGPAEEKSMSKPIKKLVHRRRHVRDTRFMPVIRPMCRAQRKAVIRKDATTLINEAKVMPLLLETLRWDEEQDSNRGESTVLTPLSYIPQSILRESMQMRMQIDSLTEELAAMRLQMQQMKSTQTPPSEREEKEQQTSSEKGNDDDVQ